MLYSTVTLLSGKLQCDVMLLLVDVCWEADYNNTIQHRQLHNYLSKYRKIYRGQMTILTAKL